MRPAQFGTQRVHNRHVRVGLGKADAQPQLALAPAPAIAERQLSRQRRDNLLAIVGALFPQYVLTNPLPDLPVEQRQLGVHRHGRPQPGAVDQLPDVDDERGVGKDERIHARRMRPVSSSCIIPCLRARVLSRRASRAESSASISERTVAMAVCSTSGGN